MCETAQEPDRLPGVNRSYREVIMNEIDVEHRLRQVVAELDQARRSIMADEPRRRTYMQVVKAKAEADQLLAEIERENGMYRFAAE
jgi:hypothetical protein